MRIEILASAMHDLLEGSAFYERQREGLGVCLTNAHLFGIDALQRRAPIPAPERNA